MKNKKFTPIKRLSLRDEVYETLKNSIVQLDFEPGARLHDKELAEDFGISRTPVREALKRLEDEGLVESTPGSSTRVTPLKEEEASHAFTVAAALHALGARLSIPQLAERDLDLLESANEELELALKQQDFIGAIKADEAFHQIYLQAAKNPEIISALKRIIPKIQRLEIAQFGSLNGLKSVEQHKKIIEVSRQRNADMASRLVEENWLSLGELLTSKGK
ncbi:GntR family transcriptional regulator [Aeromicrobium ponti]|uniref:Transcriptional regulator, GntR family n=1 Tax=Cytobacillus oceanisediminis TaxID=665099 RepID=A0A562JGE0_9BACI|nr:GntR family transcriptional regulator [Cytobacillus oceanisediminis]TWH82229.1 transcriptional regulator, GntR family [Cytobacillus oceanisediminis]